MTHTDAGSEGRLVAMISDLGREDLAFAGGKGANLGELMRGGFAVPDGFVVSTGAYRTALRAGDLARAIESRLGSGDASGDDGSAVRNAFARATVPDDVRAAIIDSYARLGGGPVAVRSSATAEDLPGAAFAGQQDTFLDVDGEEAVLDAVRRCWGSLWTDRAIAYRRRLGIDDREVAIAVVVQRMVDAEFAGVMFTADPVTGDRSHVVVDATSGLGEAVVSGTVTPDHFVVDPRGRIRERRPGQPRHGQGQGVVPDDVVIELASVGRSVAEHFGRPQDVEWAHAGGRTWLVHARPMTALPPPPLRLNPIQRRVTPMLLDYVNVRPYPLDMSAWTLPGIGHLVERMLVEIPGLSVDFASMLPEIDGVVERFVPPSPRPTPALLTAPVRLLPKIRRYRPAAWTDDARLAHVHRAMDELNAVDLTSLGWSDLLQVPRRALAVTDVVAGLRVDYLPRVGVDLLRLRALLRVLGLTGLFPMLILGGHTRTEDANRALEELAAQVRADPALRAAFTSLEAPDLLRRVEQDAGFAEFASALHRFAGEYGHRETTSLILMSAPTWGEDLEIVLSLVKVLIDEPPEPVVTHRTAAAEARLEARRLVRLTRSGRPARRIVRAAREGIAFREDTHFYATVALPVLRRALLEAGGRLAAAGLLDARDEVLHLRLEELDAITDPVRVAPDDAERLRGLVRRRAARRAELAGVPLISVGSLFPPAGDADDVLLSGVAAGAGRVTAAVRIVQGPEEFATMRSGEVLVCPYTNPAWTPLFQRAAAVVVDSGGLASHAAIVAREYGIPAIMGTGSGTAVLSQGQRVTVDGDTGRVMRA